MHITIPARETIPATEIFVKIIKKNNNLALQWSQNVIILIHGGPGGNHTLYSDIENDLSKICDVVLIDLRGCGLSAKIDVQYCTFDIHIDDIKAILSTLEIYNPIIHGCSYGAIVALGFGINYPEVPKKLILSSCVASGDFIKSAKQELLRKGTITQIKAAEKLWNGDFKNAEEFSAYYDTMASLYFFKKQTAHALPSGVQKIPYNVALVNLAFTTFLRTFNFNKKLSKVKANTLIFAGKNDWIFSIKQAEILHSGIHNATLISLDKCGHFPWKDQRKVFLATVKDFILL